MVAIFSGRPFSGGLLLLIYPSPATCCKLLRRCRPAAASPASIGEGDEDLWFMDCSKGDEDDGFLRVVGLLPPSVHINKGDEDDDFSSDGGDLFWL